MSAVGDVIQLDQFFTEAKRALNDKDDAIKLPKIVTKTKDQEDKEELVDALTGEVLAPDEYEIVNEIAWPKIKQSDLREALEAQTHRTEIFAKIYPLLPKKTLLGADLPALVRYLDFMHIYNNLTEQVFSESFEWVSTSTNKVSKLNPLFGAWREMGNMLSVLEGHLGLTRSSRKDRGLQQGQTSQPFDLSVLEK